MARAPRKKADAAGSIPAATPATPPAASELAAAGAAAVEAAAVAEAAAAENAPLVGDGDGEALPPVNIGDLDLTGMLLSVRSVSPQGRRRAGHGFGPVPIDIAADALSPRELDGLLNDPELVVGIIGPATEAD